MNPGVVAAGLTHSLLVSPDSNVYEFGELMGISTTPKQGCRYSEYREYTREYYSRIYSRAVFLPRIKLAEYSSIIPSLFPIITA